jgi:hypothetical protein
MQVCLYYYKNEPSLVNFKFAKFHCHQQTQSFLITPYIPGDQEGLFKLAVQLRKIFNSVIYNTATGYVLLVYLTNI